MTRTGCGASPPSETAVPWLPERLGDNAEESAASGPGPEKLQDHPSDQRDDASEEQPGVGLSEACDLDLLGVLGHIGEGCIVIVEGSDLGDADTADGVFKPKAIEEEPDLEPLLVFAIIHATTKGNAWALRQSLSLILGPFAGPRAGARTQVGAELTARENAPWLLGDASVEIWEMAWRHQIRWLLMERATAAQIVQSASITMLPSGSLSRRSTFRQSAILGVPRVAEVEGGGAPVEVAAAEPL